MIVRITKSKLFRSAGVYTLSNILNAGIPFFLLPVLTRFLTPYDYGLVATFQVLVSLSLPIIGLAIPGAIARKYYDTGLDNLSTFIGNGYLILASSSILITAFVFAFSKPISALAEFPESWLWFVVATAVGNLLCQITLSLWQVQVKPFRYGTFQTLLSLLNVFLSIFFVVWWGMGWRGRLLGQVLAAGLFGALAFFVLSRSGMFRWRFNRNHAREILAFGVPLIPHTLGGWAIAAADRIYLNRMIGVSETGIYTVAFQVVMVLQLIQVSFNTAWVPWFYDKMNRKEPEMNRKIVYFTYGYVLINLFAAGLMTLLAPWGFKVLLGKSFLSATKYVFCLSFSKGIMALYFMTCNYIFYTKKNWYIACATGFSAVVHLICLYVFIKSNGALGAAQASLVSSLVLALLVWFVSARLVPMPWFSLWGKLKKSDTNVINPT